MRKLFVALLAGAVAVGLAAPAFAADLKFSGFTRFRFQFDENMGCMTEQAGTDCSGHEIDTRFVPKFEVETEGGVRAVLRLEIGDLRFGETATVGKGATGGAGNDGVNVETKWAYMDFPIPATPLRLRAGLQSVGVSKDLFFGDDFPGLSVYGKLGQIDANFFWVRGNNAQSTAFAGAEADANAVVSAGVGPQGEDARDIYGIDLTFSPRKDLTLNGYLVYDHDMENVVTTTGESTTGFWIGAAVAGKVQNIRYDLDFVYGTKETTTAGVDQKGYAVDGGVGMAVAGTPLDLDLRFWYATGQDSATGDSDAFPILIGPDHESGMMSVWGGGDPIDFDLVLADNFQNTWGVGVVAKYTVRRDLTLTANFHYIGTVEEGTSTFASPAGDGRIFGVESIGYDVGVRMDYAIYKGLVLTLVAGQLFLTDDTAIVAVGGISQFEDVTKVAGQLFYSF